MIKCPNCNTEFEEKNDKCPNCGQQLVAEPDKENTENPVIAEVVTPSEQPKEAETIEPENLSFFSISGRIGRKAFNMRWIPLAFLNFALSCLTLFSPNTASKISLYMIIVPLTIYALTFVVRRLRDIGLSKWKIIGVVLITLIPQNNIIIALLNLIIYGYLIFKKGKYEPIS
ncbi:MAG: DUF805 domain-containing protein [Acidaminococcaceae bacterium]